MAFSSGPQQKLKEEDAEQQVDRGGQDQEARNVPGQGPGDENEERQDAADGEGKRSA